LKGIPKTNLQASVASTHQKACNLKTGQSTENRLRSTASAFFHVRRFPALSVAVSDPHTVVEN
jgi:hypothetical protein